MSLVNPLGCNVPQYALLIKLTDLWFMGFFVGILWTLQVHLYILIHCENTSISI